MERGRERLQPHSRQVQLAALAGWLGVGPHQVSDITAIVIDFDG